MNNIFPNKNPQFNQLNPDTNKEKVPNTRDIGITLLNESSKPKLDRECAKNRPKIK